MGLPTTSTLTVGHIETPLQQIPHPGGRCGSFQPAFASGRSYNRNYRIPFCCPLWVKQRHQACAVGVVATNAVMADAPAADWAGGLAFTLGIGLQHHQPSWVKLGLHGGNGSPALGCNDIGGTLMEEQHHYRWPGRRGYLHARLSHCRLRSQSIHPPMAEARYPLSTL